MRFNRYQASGAHLLGSVGIGLVSAAAVFLMWYPGPLAAATGVTDIFLMLLAVDVVIGPFITLIVFNPAKKELKRDLSIVLLLQMAALLYGLHAVFIARPAYMVFNVDRFDLIYANELTDEKLATARDAQFKTVPVFGPQTIAARRPDSKKERSDLMFGSLAGGDDLHQMPQYYEPYANQTAGIVARLVPMEKLQDFNKSDASALSALKQKYAGRAVGIGYLPVKGRVKDLTAVIARDSAQVLELTTLRPW